jgi:hypothetical protein
VVLRKVCQLQPVTVELLLNGVREVLVEHHERSGRRLRDRVQCFRVDGRPGEHLADPIQGVGDVRWLLTDASGGVSQSFNLTQEPAETSPIAFDPREAMIDQLEQREGCGAPVGFELRFDPRDLGGEIGSDSFVQKGLLAKLQVFYSTME